MCSCYSSDCAEYGILSCNPVLCCSCSCLAYFTTLEKEAICSSETLGFFQLPRFTNYIQVESSFFMHAAILLEANDYNKTSNCKFLVSHKVSRFYFKQHSVASTSEVWKTSCDPTWVYMHARTLFLSLWDVSFCKHMFPS
jgi:hypothetical protein